MLHQAEAWPDFSFYEADAKKENERRSFLEQFRDGGSPTQEKE
jgi:hypothetical protein